MLQESCQSRDSASSDSPFVSTDREKVLVLLLSLYFLPSLFARGPVCGEFKDTDQMPGLTMLGCDWSNSVNDLLPLVNPVSILLSETRPRLLMILNEHCTGTHHSLTLPCARLGWVIIQFI